MHKYFYSASMFLTATLLLLVAGCSASVSEELTILPRSTWNAAPPKPFATHVPVRITIHHEGTVFDPTKESGAEHIKKVQTWGMSEARNWADIPYHFLIDFDGNVYEGRNPFTTGETNTEYDPSGHLLISLLGNFEVQEVPKKQLNALYNLTAYCCTRYNIDPSTIKAHRDYAKTDCPGKNLYPVIRDGILQEEASSRIK